MSKAAKLIIVILVLLVVGSAGFAVSLMNEKTLLQQTKAKLEDDLAQANQRETKLIEESKDLKQKLTEAGRLKDDYQRQVADLNGKMSDVNNKVKDLNGQIDKISAERNDWKSKVDGLRKERDELMAKLAERPEPPPAPVAPAPTEQVAQGTSAGEGAILGADDEHWAAVLKEKAALEVELNGLKEQFSKNEVAVEELKKKNSELELELSGLKNEKEEIERKLKYSEDLANTLSIELAREKNDKRYVGTRLDKIKEEGLALRAQVKELMNTKLALEKSISRLRDDKGKIEKRLAETESVIQNRIDDVIEIKNTLDKKVGKVSATQAKEVELPPIIVSAPSPTAKPSVGQLSRPSGLEGRVLSVNEENNFVVVDIGQNSGVRIGDKLGVYRQDKYIAGLEVIQTRKDISAADIKEKATAIKVGDLVR